MVIRLLALSLIVIGGLCAMWISIYRSMARRRDLMNVGVQLVRPEQVTALFRHDRALVRLLERIVQQDRSIPILNKEDRVEAERLIQAFYDDKGD